MDAMEALDALAVRNVELIGQVGPDQWDHHTPCTQWNVRFLVGHLIAGRQAYCAILHGAPLAELRSIMAGQGEAAGPDPVAACEDAARSLRAAFSEPGVMERTVLHPGMGEMLGSQLLSQGIADCVVHSWDLATAIGADPGLDEQLVGLAYAFYEPLCVDGGVAYAKGYFAPPTRPLPLDATQLDRLIRLVGR